MTCPSCRGNHTGPLACRKCRGAGVIGPAEPQRLSPPQAAWYDRDTGTMTILRNARNAGPFAALIP
jgi:hypothetical protein